MKLLAAELIRVELPFVSEFRSALGAERSRDALLVRLLSDGPDGWGECAAPRNPGYTSEYAEGAHAVVRDTLLPLLFATASIDAATATAKLAASTGTNMARAMLEMALLDSELRAAGQSLAARLGATRTAVAAGVVAGIARSPGALVDEVGRCLDEGYRRVKLKIQPGWDIEPVAAVRSRFPEAMLTVDANGSYRSTDAEHLAGLDAYGLAMLEQPLPAGDLAAHAELAERLNTPICLDESIDSLQRAEQAMALRACAVVNVKASRLGGLLEALRVHDLCFREGMPVWCGGMFETGLGRAANLALAALPGFTLPADISPAGRHFADELTSPPAEMRDGSIAVPSGPGLGVDVDVTALRRVTTRLELVRP